MQATSPFCSLFNVRRAGVLVSTALFVLLPFVIGAPTNDDTMKQQIAQGLLRDDLWNSLNQGKYYDGYPSRPGRPWVPHTYPKRFDSLSGDTFGYQYQKKRNFDEIDRNGFGSFVKRNFDEIDRTGLGFSK